WELDIHSFPNVPPVFSSWRKQDEYPKKWLRKILYNIRNNTREIHNQTQQTPIQE
ncbi:hypothetical protein WA026_007820, partial [Henosepilachna vigintioctopunctata]